MLAAISLLYSDELGKLTWDLKLHLEETFNSLCHEVAENSVSGLWTDIEKKNVIYLMMNEWNRAKLEVVSFFNGMYTNWNPCYTSTGDLTGIYKLPDITTIKLSDIIDACLQDGDFSSLDQLFCNVVNSYCRHIVHRGKDGKPAKTDYCYKVDKVLTDDSPMFLVFKMGSMTSQFPTVVILSSRT